MKKMKIGLLIVALLGSASVADDSVDYVFSSGTPIKASEMNANFEKLSAKIAELRTLSSNSQSAYKTFVGVSTTAVTGGTGVVNMNNVCHDTFAGSRMCNTDDILHNGNVGLTTTLAWMHPILIYVDNPYYNAISLPYFVDTLSHSSGYNFSCNGWTSFSASNKFYGRTTHGSTSCSSELPVACCK